MSKNNRLLLKVFFIIIGLLIIIYILTVSIRMNMIKQPEGEYIRLQDALILSSALDEAYALDAAYLELENGLQADKEAMLNYGQFMKLIQMIAQKPGIGEFADEEEDTVATAVVDIGAQCEKEYKRKYKDEFSFLKEDWYRIYDRLLVYYDMQSVITRSNVTVLGIGADVTDQDGNALPEKTLFAEEGKYSYKSDIFTKYKYRAVETYKTEDVLLTVISVVSRGYSLHNEWIMEADGERLQAFVLGHEIWFPYTKAEQSQREQIADLEFADGILQSVKIKSEKINGKLLSVRDGNMEIEGYGKYPYKEDIKVYRLYGTLSECEENDLRIGYNFTDFVLEDGVICAGLITRDEAMENIRVVVKNTDFAGAYHEKIELTADTDFTVRYGRLDALQREDYKAGEKVTIDEDSEYFIEDRIYIEPMVLTGRIQLLSVQRAQGTPGYRGKLEVERTTDGLVVVNEVLLEEYLYSVVPSEMPASYPLESLKAQAICARTYAYRHMMRSGIAGFGAHVDDSAGYQVYNNIAENAQTTKAVKETSGQLLYYGEELCGAYYYSTSCGFGSDINIWKSGSTEDTSYLTATRIGTERDAYTGDEMAEEDIFESFITQAFSSDYESEEAWYRWRYEVDAVNTETIISALQKRYEVNEKLVLTKGKDGDFASKPVKKIGKLKDIYIEKRNAGGAADELIIAGTENTYKVISEHNIRYVLNNGSSRVIRQDGSEIATSTLLPSAYMVITTSKEDEVVVGYTLVGGGYGHGVGMAQNGAKSMAGAGFAAQDILTFFYQACEVKNVY